MIQIIAIIDNIDYINRNHIQNVMNESDFIEIINNDYRLIIINIRNSETIEISLNNNQIRIQYDNTIRQITLYERNYFIISHYNYKRHPIRTVSFNGENLDLNYISFNGNNINIANFICRRINNNYFYLASIRGHDLERIIDNPNIICRMV
jgi:hypothetical protein